MQRRAGHEWANVAPQYLHALRWSSFRCPHSGQNSQIAGSVVFGAALRGVCRAIALESHNG